MQPAWTPENGNPEEGFSSGLLVEQASQDSQIYPG